MSAPATIPLTIASEASARVAELGMQAEFEQMLEHLRQTVPHLLSLQVLLIPPYDTGDTPGVVIDAIQDEPYQPEDSLSNTLRKWMVMTFPPQVCEHFSIWLGWKD